MPKAQASLFADEKPACPTHSSMVDYDFPVGEWNGIALVGEAPGAEEVKQGHPFVGRSGQLLDKMLVEAGIERSRCLVANVFRFQPPGNKVDHFFISRRAAKEQGIVVDETFPRFGSALVRAEFATEIEHLAETLKTMKKDHPKMIVVGLGRTPLWALTGEGSLLAKVGKPLPCRLVPGVEVIPTFHPSFILRGNWGLQGEWLNHFIVAKKYV